MPFPITSGPQAETGPFSETEKKNPVFHHIVNSHSCISPYSQFSSHQLRILTWWDESSHEPVRKCSHCLCGERDLLQRTMIVIQKEQESCKTISIRININYNRTPSFSSCGWYCIEISVCSPPGSRNEILQLASPARRLCHKALCSPRHKVTSQRRLILSML